MRASGLINFVVVTSATACLLAVVTKSNSIATPSAEVYSHLPSKTTLAIDSPITQPVDLNFDFKDNNGKPPLYDPNQGFIYKTPKT